MFRSRDKGSKGELEVLKFIQPWWRQVEPEALFSRTPGSGGFGTPEVRAGFRIAGDLMVSNAPGWPFAIEIKRREGWSVSTFAEGKKSPVWGWWGQTLKAASEMSVEPLLWFRKNREPWRVLLRRTYFRSPVFDGSCGAWGWGHGSIPRTLFGLDEPVYFEAKTLLTLDPERFALRVISGAEARAK